MTPGTFTREGVELKMTLREFIEQTDKLICARFAEVGVISPMYHIVGPDDQQCVFPAPPADKDEGVRIVRRLFKAMNIQRYVFIDEAWIASSRAPEEDDKLKRFAENNSLEHYPGRQEVIMYAAESQDEGMLMGRREIIRNAIGPAQLGPLELSDYGGRAEGRMVGLLPAASETVQ